MANRLKLNEERKKMFLKVVRETASITHGARAIGMANRSLYDARERDPQFKADWDEAINQAVDDLEEEARRRAFHGTERFIFYKGQKCGSFKEYSDTLMIFLLKAHRPEKYREIIRNVNINANTDLAKLDLSDLSDAEVSQFHEMVAKLTGKSAPAKSMH